MQGLLAYWWILPIIFMIVGFKLILRLFGVVMIPEDSIGIVNKKFVLLGEHKTLPDGQIIAQNGEAGLQAYTLAPGVHFWLWPWQYEITLQEFITISEGKLGVVESRDGTRLTTRTTTSAIGPPHPPPAASPPSCSGGTKSFVA